MPLKDVVLRKYEPQAETLQQHFQRLRAIQVVEKTELKQLHALESSTSRAAAIKSLLGSF